ncbi:MAG: hypothetical protein V7776_22255 [Halopseudomonas aestusnigri]
MFRKLPTTAPQIITSIAHAEVKLPLKPTSLSLQRKSVFSLANKAPLHSIYHETRKFFSRDTHQPTKDDLLIQTSLKFFPYDLKPSALHLLQQNRPDDQISAKVFDNFCDTTNFFKNPEQSLAAATQEEFQKKYYETGKKVLKDTYQKDFPDTMDGARPSEIAMAFGAGIRQDIHTILDNNLDITRQFKAQGKNALARVSDVELGILMIETRPSNATGMLTNSAFTEDHPYRAANDEVFGKQQAHAVVLSNILDKLSSQPARILLYHLGDYKSEGAWADQKKTVPSMIRVTSLNADVDKMIDDMLQGNGDNPQFELGHIGFCSAKAKQYPNKSYSGRYELVINDHAYRGIPVAALTISPDLETILPANTILKIKDVTKIPDEPERKDTIYLENAPLYKIIADTV